MEVIRLVMSGVPKASVAKELGIGEASVYRILRRSTENRIIAERQTTLNY